METPRTVQAAIALGANLQGPAGTPAESVNQAIERIGLVSGIRSRARSSLQTTEPVGPPGQPEYVNACVLVDTALPARLLLNAMLGIERELGRDRATEVRWGPRTIDLDLILYDDDIIDEDGLTVPHPRMHERSFVLAPLAEIAPDRVVPGLNRTVSELLKELA